MTNFQEVISIVSAIAFAAIVACFVPVSCQPDGIFEGAGE